MKIATIVTPHLLNKPKRDFLIGVCQSIQLMGNAIRWNGNGGHIIHVEDEKTFLTYPPKQGYLSIAYTAIPTNEAIQQAILVAKDVYPNFESLSEEVQSYILSSIYSLVGYGGRKSDVVLCIKGNPTQLKKPQDNYMYSNMITLANNLGITYKDIGG